MLIGAAFVRLARRDLEDCSGPASDGRCGGGAGCWPGETGVGICGAKPGTTSGEIDRAP